MIELWLDLIGWGERVYRFVILDVDRVSREIKHIGKVDFIPYNHDGTVTEPDTVLTVGRDQLQTLFDDMYRKGFRPSDEIDTRSIVKVLQEEIKKRDTMIENLMNKFVYHNINNQGRSVQK